MAAPAPPTSVPTSPPPFPPPRPAPTPPPVHPDSRSHDAGASAGMGASGGYGLSGAGLGGPLPPPDAAIDLRGGAAGRPGAYAGRAAVTSDGMLAVDASGRVVDANAAALELLGATPGALVGHDAPTALDRLGHRSAALALASALAHPLPAAFTVHDASGAAVSNWRVAPDARTARRAVTFQPAPAVAPGTERPAPSAAAHDPAAVAETIAAVARELASSGADVTTALERLAGGALGLLAAAGTCVVTLDEGTARVAAGAGVLASLRGQLSRVMDPTAVFAEAVERRRVVITNAAPADPRAELGVAPDDDSPGGESRGESRVDPRLDRRSGTRREPAPAGTRHVLVAPLVVEGEVPAVLCAVDSARGGFSPADGQVARQLADFGALALRNARLVERADESAREARLLAGAARALVEHISSDGLFAAVAELARESLGASGITVILADPASGRVERVWADGVGRTMPALDVAHFWASGMGHATREATPVFFSTPAAPDAAPSDRVLAAAAERAGVRAAALLPLSTPGAPSDGAPGRGLLSLLFPEPRTFPPRERRLLADFGAHVAMAARNAALVSMREQARARAEAAAEIARAALDAPDLATGAAAILAVLDRIAPTAGKALRVTGFAGPDDPTLTCLAASGSAAALRGRRFAAGTAPDPGLAEQVTTVPLAAHGRELGDLWVASEFGGTGGGLLNGAARERLAPLAAPVAIALDALLLAEHARRRRRADDAMSEQLRQAEKMAALGELVAGVAHEINNPLTGISAFAELLLDEPLTADQRESARLIKREADRAVAVVRDLLVFSRKAEPATLPVDVNAIVERTLRARAYALRDAGIAVHVDLDVALPRVRGDESKLQQVILNMLLNAEYALRDAADRRLEVRTRRVAAHPGPAMGNVAGEIAGMGAERVVVEITDSGPGMAHETLARVFEPFFTTKPPGEGTGLGLSVSYGIVQTHGGEIVARSAPGAGATFEVLLPADHIPGAVTRDLPAPFPPRRS